MKQESAFHPAGYQSFWVRGYDLQTNVFTLSSVDSDDPEVVHVAPDEGTTMGRKATEVLRDCFTRRKQAREAVWLVLGEKQAGGKQGETGPPKLMIKDVIPPVMYRDKDARKIVGQDGKPLCQWSEELDEAVDRHQDAVVAQSAFQFHSLLMAHPDTFQKVKDRASAIFQRIAAVPLKETNVRLPDDYLAAIHGYEGDTQNPKQVRYNLLAGFVEQCAAQSGTHAWLAAAANFSIQKAILDSFVTSAIAGDKSFLLELQDELLAEKTIIAGHPNMDAHEFSRKSKEVALLIGSHVTAGIMAHANAAAAKESLDEMRHPAVHSEIKAEYENLAESARFDRPRALGAYLSLGETRLGRYEENIRFKVYDAQLKSVAPKVAPPVPPTKKNIMPSVLAMNRALAAAGTPPLDPEKIKGADGKVSEDDLGLDTATALRQLAQITLKDMESALHEIGTPII